MIPPSSPGATISPARAGAPDPRKLLGAAHYNVHDLVEIAVASDVSPGLLRGIEFQVGHFRRERASGSAQWNLRVRPFQARAALTAASLVRFHRDVGVAGQVWEAPEDHLAVRIAPDGLDVYADEGAFLLNFFVNLLLVRTGTTMVHAGGVIGPDGSALLLPGAGGVGKTALVTGLIRDHGCRLLGDDVVLLTSDGRALSYPRSFVLKEFHRDQFPELFRRVQEQERPWRTGVKRFLHENAPFKGILKAMLHRNGRLDHWHERLDLDALRKDCVAAVPVQTLFGADGIADEGPLRRVVFLERYGGNEIRLERLDHDRMAARLVSIIHHEWGPYFKEIFAMGSLEILDPKDYLAAVDRVVRSALRSRPCELLRIPEATSAPELARRAPDVLGL